MIPVNQPPKFTLQNDKNIVTSDPYSRYLQYEVLNKSSLFLAYLKLLNVLSVTKITKQLRISFVTALLPKRYGMV